MKRDSDDENESTMLRGKVRADKAVLRYGDDSETPLEHLSESDDMFVSESDSDDDPVPESAGQIKVALFRVLASGEIRKGEYSPQFDAHDDSTDGGGKMNKGTTEEVDHTTSFAQPKTLDPKSISTQTVTGIDSSDKPFAVFTFLYRGESECDSCLLSCLILNFGRTTSKDGHHSLATQSARESRHTQRQSQINGRQLRKAKASRWIHWPQDLHANARSDRTSEWRKEAQVKQEAARRR